MSKKKRQHKITDSDFNAISHIVRHTHLNSKPVYDLTPQNILYTALDTLLTTDESVDDFEREIISKLSLLATNGSDSTIFGKDFNDLFTVFIRVINNAGRMKKLLDDNGIDFNFNDTN